MIADDARGRQGTNGAFAWPFEIERPIGALQIFFMVLAVGVHTLYRYIAACMNQ